MEWRKPADGKLKTRTRSSPKFFVAGCEVSLFPRVHLQTGRASFLSWVFSPLSSEDARSWLFQSRRVDGRNEFLRDATERVSLATDGDTDFKAGTFGLIDEAHAELSADTFMTINALSRYAFGNAANCLEFVAHRFIPPSYANEANGGDTAV